MKCRLKVCIARSALLDRLVNGHELVLDVVYDEILSQSFRCFVVHDLELDVVSELKKPLVSVLVGVDNSGFAAAGQELDVDVALVDR